MSAAEPSEEDLWVAERLGHTRATLVAVVIVVECEEVDSIEEKSVKSDWGWLLRNSLVRLVVTDREYTGMAML